MAEFVYVDNSNVFIEGKRIAAIQNGKTRNLAEANEIETPEAGMSDVKPTSLFPKENLKIRLSDGTVVVPQENVATPVAVTGEVSLTDKNSSGSEKLCSIHATKVEKR